MQITGDYTGDVIFTAPKPMLTMLLARYGDKNTGEAYLLDLVGEIANTIAGNSREFFGGRFDLSPPVVATGDIAGLRSQSGLKTYCIPISWKNQTAKLLVAVE
jgi:chemotaxis protein CheX